MEERPHPQHAPQGEREAAQQHLCVPPRLRFHTQNQGADRREQPERVNAEGASPRRGRVALAHETPDGANEEPARRDEAEDEFRQAVHERHDADGDAKFTQQLVRGQLPPAFRAQREADLQGEEPEHKRPAAQHRVPPPRLRVA